MKHRAVPFLAAGSVGAALALAGCVSVPDSLAAPADQTAPRLSIEAYDGSPADPLDAPRRPRLRITGLPVSAEPPAWLFAGTLDRALEDDLMRAPLLAESRARSVPCEQSQLNGALELVPLEPLQPGAEHVLAVAAWALEELAFEAPLALDIVASRAANGGARVVAAWPPDGAVGVGTDVPSVWLAFDGEVRGAEQGLWLEGPDGHAIEAQVVLAECDATQRSAAPEAALCARLTPSAWLAPLAPHRIVVGRATQDARGAPVGPYAALFRTAAGPDAQAPQPVQHTCAIDEQPFELGCAQVSDRTIALRVAASEPFELVVRDGARSLQALAPAAVASLVIADVEPGELRTLELELRDSTGNTLQHRLELRTHDDLPALSISEVRPDPLGPEPDQELVELWNYGERVIDLEGMTLSDRSDELGEPLPAGRIDPGVRVLLVPETFDATSGDDVPVPPGTPLVRVGRALGTSGLANRGEALYLRDARGLRLSAAPALESPMPGVCLQRVGEDPRAGAAAAFAFDPEQRCTPGR